MTIYLFAEIRNGRLVNKRRSENPAAKENETHIATLFRQPENYWELVARIPRDLNDLVLDDRTT